MTGAVREVRQGGLKPATRTFTTLVGLHEAHFAGPALRILFFVCGLMGSAMVATGLVLWAVARLPKAGERGLPGLRLVQALNIGAVAGLPAPKPASPYAIWPPPGVGFAAFPPTIFAFGAFAPPVIAVPILKPLAPRRPAKR